MTMTKIKWRIKWTPYLMSIGLAVASGIAYREAHYFVPFILAYLSGWLSANSTEREP
jgi:hypothetical protein